jgi:hypothetical protein
MELTKYFLAIDLVSTNVTLLHHRSANLKTYVGSILTLIILIFFIYSISYFGSDLILKQQPITRYSKEYTNTSRIYIKDYPFRIVITDVFGTLLPKEKYLSFQGTYSKIGIENDYVSVGYLIFETCRDEFIPVDRISMFKTGVETFFKNSFCINPFKYISSNGTVVEEDVYIQNSFGVAGSSYMNVNILQCSNTTENGNICLSTKDQGMMLEKTLMTAAFIDSYVDYANYNNPDKYFNSFISTQLTNADTKKSHLLTVKQTRVITDSGFILEDLAEYAFAQVDSARSDVFNGNDLYRFQIEGNNINDVHSRRYIKVQEIIASIGGLIKFLFLFASLLVDFFANLDMRLEIFNSLYSHSGVSYESPCNSSISNLKQNDLSIIRLNNKSKSPSNEMRLKGKVSVADYMRGVFRCKSVYGKDAYLYFNNYIYGKLEISNMIKDSLSLENLLSRKEEGPCFDVGNKGPIIHGVETNVRSKFGLKDMKEITMKLSKSTEKIINE